MPKYAVTLDGYERYLQNLAKKWTNQKNKKYEMLHFGDLNKTHFIRFMRRDTIHLVRQHALYQFWQNMEQKYLK